MCTELSRKLRCSIAADLAQRVNGSFDYKIFVLVFRGHDERVVTIIPLEFDMDVEGSHDTAINALAILRPLVRSQGIDTNVWFKQRVLLVASAMSVNEQQVGDQFLESGNLGKDTPKSAMRKWSKRQFDLQTGNK